MFFRRFTHQYLHSLCWRLEQGSQVAAQQQFSDNDQILGGFLFAGEYVSSFNGEFSKSLAKLFVEFDYGLAQIHLENYIEVKFAFYPKSCFIENKLK